MSDFLQNPMVKQIAKSLNLPLPIPALLNRNNNAYSKNEWQTKKTAIVTTSDEDTEAQKIIQILKPYINESSLYQENIDAVVISGLAIDNIEMSVEFFTKAQLAVQKLNKNARVVVLSKKGNNAESITIQKSFEGFSRALSKELGKNGTTVNHLVIKDTPAEDVARAILFFISDKSSFITGQVIVLNNNYATAIQSTNQLLSGKTAIVTGAARGIGAATATFLAREGAKVIIVDVPQAEEDAKKLAEEINGDVLLMDITQENAVASIQKHVIDNYGQLDILINNAGITRDKTLAKMSIAQWNSIMQVNLKAAMNLTEAFIAKGFSKNPKIVGLASISGIAGNVGQTNYSASKAGMIAFMNTLFVEKGLMANAVAPGFIETKMTESLPLFVKEGGRRLSTLKQGGQPEDVAELITFLSSSLSDGVAGQVIRVCGGSMIGA
ncbi:MAG: 3-oxoacyl-ACP reductase [Sphingobacteriales bacterium]|nr:MAG: 3-oxoacyl-ACP reductase [Sphingobacteriales bacterium]